jgi:transcriptional regulator with XRE-family HTH domain
MAREHANIIDQVIARRIVDAREASGLSKADMAERLKLSRQGYTPYERGNHHFTVAELQDFARVLGRPIEYFLGLDQPGFNEDEHEVLGALRAIQIPMLRHLAVAQVQAIAGVPPKRWGPLS